MKTSCAKHPPTEARANVLKRMSLGLLPTTARYLQNLINAGRQTAEVAEAEARRAAHADSTTPQHDPHQQRCHHHHSHDDDLRDDRDDARKRARVAHDQQPHAENVRAKRYRRNIVVEDGGAHEQTGNHLRDLGGTAPNSGTGQYRDKMSTALHIQSYRRVSETMEMVGLAEPPPNVHGGGSSSTAVATTDDFATTGSREDDGRILNKPPASERCRPMPDTSWANRLVISATTPAGVCHRCGGTTRARCRGCMRMMCMTCAKNQKLLP